METIKDIIENMAIKQGIDKIKFTSKTGETLAHHDWIAGVDYDAINDPTEINDDEINNDDPIEDENEDTFGIDQTNPIAETLVENIETYNEENNDIENVIDKMIDDEVIPEGEEIINDKMVETVDPTEDPVEQFSQPTRE